MKDNFVKRVLLLMIMIFCAIVINTFIFERLIEASKTKQQPRVEIIDGRE